MIDYVLDARLLLTRQSSQWESLLIHFLQFFKILTLPRSISTSISFFERCEHFSSDNIFVYEENFHLESICREYSPEFVETNMHHSETLLSLAQNFHLTIYIKSIPFQRIQTKQIFLDSIFFFKIKFVKNIMCVDEDQLACIILLLVRLNS